MGIDADFDEFWKLYPRRIGRLAAERAYEKARKRATADAILAGLMLFNRNLPHEERFICHAQTWLNQGRWMDELPGVRQTQQTDWFQECQEIHNGECGLNRWRHHERKEIDAIKSQQAQEG